jgi:tetratricopeptide (TPR) repeat protein
MTRFAFQLTLHPIAAAVILAALVRLAHFFGFAQSPLAAAPILDAELYTSWARRIAAGDWLGDEVFYANPLYPYFLGALFRLFGESLELARLVQHGLGVATVALVAATTRTAFGAGAALAAGLLCALYRPFLLYEDLLLTETLVVFLGAAAIASCLSAATTARAAGRAAGSRPLDRRFLGAGILLGLGLLARPTLLPLAALAWLAAGSRRGALAAALGLALAVAPVTLRNWYVSGSPVLITAHGGETFYVGNRIGADGSNRQPDFVRSGPLTEHEDYRREASRRLGREVDLATASRYWQNQALSEIAADPAAWLKLEAKKFGLLLHAYEKGDNEDPEAARTLIPIQALPLPGYGLVVALACLGALAARRERRHRRPAALLALAAGAYAAGCLIIFVTARYRLPLAVALLPLAGGAIAALGAVARGPHPLRRLLPAVGLLGLLLLTLHRPLPAADRNDPAIAAVNLGFLREQQGDLDGAVASYRQAIARRPDFPLAHFNLGVAERLRGNLPAAAAALGQALNLDPDYADALDQLAMTREQSGDLDTALTLYRRAIRIDSTRARYYRDLGRLHVRRGEASAAEAAWAHALLLDPSDSTTASRLATLRQAMERQAPEGSR